MLTDETIAAWIQPTRVHRAVFTCPEIFTLEMTRIFARTWVYCGHESQVPANGDYRLVTIGDSAFIMIRGDDGQIRLLANACRHRGLRLLEEEAGHTKSLLCPYHGWLYDCRGRLRRVPQPQGQIMAFDPAQNGLALVARCDSYRGFVFASLDPDAPALLDHLGGARPFIDLFCDLSPTGKVRVDLGATRYEYTGNWKQQVENSMDGYHVAVTHGSFIKSILRARLGTSMERLVDETSSATSVALGNGHALLDYRDFDRRRIMGARQPDTAATDAWHDQLRARLGPARAEEVLRCNGADGFNLLVYPNMMLINNQIRVVVPLAWDRTRVLAYPAALPAVDPAINAQRLRAHEDFYGTAAFGAADDIEMFERQWLGLTSSSEPEWLSYERGIEREMTRRDGSRVGHVSDETGQRGIWRQWRALMLATGAA